MPDTDPDSLFAEVRIPRQVSPLHQPPANAIERHLPRNDSPRSDRGSVSETSLVRRGLNRRLTQQARSRRKKRHSVALPPDSFEQYERLPSRSRGVFIERALLSFLAQGYSQND